MKPHLEKTRPVKDRDILGEYARRWSFCAACGLEEGTVAMHLHHIVGGRGGRSDENCNLLKLCWSPCHDLAGGLDVPFVHYDPASDQWKNGRLMPKLTLGIQLSLKARLGELSVADETRLTVLHGRCLPDREPIPAWFVEAFRRNRPELNGGG